MPFRIFEFAIGAAVWMMEARGRPGRAASEALSLAGLIAVGISYFVLDERSSTPVMMLTASVGAAASSSAPTGPSRPASDQRARPGDRPCVLFALSVPLADHLLRKRHLRRCRRNRDGSRDQLRADDRRSLPHVAPCRATVPPACRGAHAAGDCAAFRIPHRGAGGDHPRHVPGEGAGVAPHPSAAGGGAHSRPRRHRLPQRQGVLHVRRHGCAADGRSDRRFLRPAICRWPRRLSERKRHAANCRATAAAR